MANNIIIIKNQNDFQYARNKGLLDNAIIIILSFSLFQLVRNDKWNIVPIWELSTDEDLLNALKLEKPILEKFWYPFGKKIGLNEEIFIPLFQLIYFLDEALISDLLVNKIIDKFKPSLLTNFRTEKQIPCEEGAWSCTVFDAVLEFICLKYNVDYQPIISDYKQHPLKKSANSSRINDLFHYFKGAAEIPFALIKYRVLQKNRAVSLVSEKEWRERHKWIQLPFEEKFNNRIIPLLSSPKFKSINIFTNGLFSKCISKKRITRRYLKVHQEFYSYKNEHNELSELLNNTGLDFHWNNILRILVSNLENAKRRVKRISWIFNPQMLLISQVHQAITVASSIEFKKRGGITFLLQHATIPYPHKEFYHIHDWISVTGNFQLSKIASLGLSEKQFFKVNDQRYARNKVQDKDLLKKKHGINSNTVITIVTRNAQAGTGYFPKWDVTVSMRKTIDYLVAASTLIEHDSQRTVIFKSHPHRDYYDLYNSFSQQKGVKHFRYEPINEILELSDILVFIGPVTDALFEVIKNNKNIIICDSGLDQDLLEIISKDISIVTEPQMLKNSVDHIIKHGNSPNYNLIIKQLLSIDN